MASMGDHALRQQLLVRRRRLQAELPAEDDSELIRLLNEVDAALERMDRGTYGFCDVCHGPIESERLLTNPLTRCCLDHLTAEQQRALERDLELAANIQRALLPKGAVRKAGWEVYYYYEPLGPVSGDYCDIIPTEDGEAGMLLLLGDVSGKGVAASMLMAHLNALFRSLGGLEMGVCELMERANRVFCESTLASHFATLVCMRAQASGEVEICNAGHGPVALVQGGKLTVLESSDLPLGMFTTAHFSSRSRTLQPGDTILVCTDGLSEAQSPEGAEYSEQLEAFAQRNHDLPADRLIRAWLEDVRDFRAGSRPADDLAAMVIRRS